MDVQLTWTGWVLICFAIVCLLDNLTAQDSYYITHMNNACSTTILSALAWILLLVYIGSALWNHRWY